MPNRYRAKEPVPSNLADFTVPSGCPRIVDRILREQGAYMLLAAPPLVLGGAGNRAAYGGDGDYFTKPSSDDLVLAIHRMMEERSPARFPPLAP